jgi:hypothetical protein
MNCLSCMLYQRDIRRIQILNRFWSIRSLTGPSFSKRSYQQLCHVKYALVPERLSVEQTLACTEDRIPLQLFELRSCQAGVKSLKPQFMPKSVTDGGISDFRMAKSITC